MRRSTLLLCALATVIPFHGVQAQTAADVFGRIIGFAADQIERQQRREQQKRYHRHLNQQFTAQWHACFQGQIDACDYALTYPYLNHTDRSRLVAQRSVILTKRQEAAARLQRQRFDAELDRLRRQREAREQADREFARRQAEAARLQRLREQEEQRLAEARTYSRNHDACRRYDVASCDSAIASSHVTPEDMRVLREWRATALRYQTDRERCKRGAQTACMQRWLHRLFRRNTVSNLKTGVRPSSH